MTKPKVYKWLLDAEVQSKVEYVKCLWLVSLIFIDTKDPNRLLIREIGDYRSERLAEIAALNMKNTAAKDMRGTQKVNKDAYNFNKN
ncbi:MAG: hypothetical protein VW441_05245 [Flavobacteriaceae bacterium]